MKKFALALIAIATMGTTAFAASDRQPPRDPQPRPPQRDQVVRLGSTRLGPIKDADLIRVNSCAGSDRDRIESIQIRAAQHTATVEEVSVYFANGNADVIRTNMVLREGQRSNWIDLRGRGRCIQAIRVVGSATHIIHQATIEIFGLSRMRSQLDLQDRREEL